MSFDELTPGSTPPLEQGDAASSAAQTTSGTDAPPVAPRRRQRSRQTGTAAASEPTPPAAESVTPVRPPVSRRKPKAPPALAEDSAREPATGEHIASPEPLGTELQKIAAPSRSRRLRGAKKADEPAETPPAEPESTPPPAEELRTVASRRRARPVRSKPTEAPQTEAVSEQDLVTPDQESPTVLDPASAPTPVGRGSRSRRSRPRPASGQILPVVIPAPDAEITREETESSKAIAPDAPSELVERQGRRRRGTRGRRGESSPIPGVQPVAPIGIPGVDETTAPDEDISVDEDGRDPETGELALGRARRRRSKRSTARQVEVEIPEVDLLPVETEYHPPLDLDLTVGAHIVLRNGMPEIHIHGSGFAPILFFGNMDDTENRAKPLAEIRAAAAAGVHIHSTLVELPCPAPDNSLAFEVAAERISAILNSDPDGYVIPRVVFVPARGWKRANPSEVATYADGSSGDPSVASEIFWTEAQRSVEKLIAFLTQTNEGAYTSRIAGYHLERGEWFHPQSLGYDRCIANRDGFREWLKSKYRNNIVLLRAAWYDGDAQFGSVEIPAQSPRTNENRSFYEPRRERAIIDFHEYTSEITAKRLIDLATSVKIAASHNALVSVCYGYTFEFGHTFSGHLALGLLEKSKAIDIICGPPSYRDRTPGGAASIPAPIDSPLLHGKLWLSEDDTKTFLAPEAQDPEDFNIRLLDRRDTEQAQQRALGRTVAHATGIGFMDLWGEGWLDDETIWSQIAVFVSRYKAQLDRRKHSRIPDVVALIDERSLLHVQKNEQFLRRLTSGLRDSLQRAGVSFGVYLQSDILSDTFPVEAKLYLFMTPYRLNTELQAAVKEKLQNSGKTLAWIYAPGSCEERPSIGGAMEETATSTIGIALRQQEWHSEIGSRIVDTHHVLTDRLSGREVGVRERLNPSFYVDDPDSTTLAEYQGSGLPSIAVKNCGDWKSVFVGDPYVSVDLLRGICRYAGVHVWTPQGDDIIDIGNGYVTIHAVKEGHRLLRLPDATGLYDVNDSRHIADEIREHRFFLRSGETRSFCVGSADRFIMIGLPNVAPPAPGRPNPEPPPARVPEIRKEPQPQLPRNSDLETLEAVLNMDISSLQDVDFDALPTEPVEFIFDNYRDADADGTGEIVAGGRRRRRRGGRGRGRRTASDAIIPGSPEIAADAGETQPIDHAIVEEIKSSVSDILEHRSTENDSYLWIHPSETTNENVPTQSDDSGDASV